MNLNAIVSTSIGAVNPSVPVQVQISNGYVTAADGSRTSTYQPAFGAIAQVQDLSQGELRQVEGLGIQGAQRGIYVNGYLSGAVRWSQKGGDILVLQNQNGVLETYLTTAVLEQWSTWVKVSATLQNGG